MTGKSRWLALVCIVSLFVAVAGCSDDDDIIPDQQVSGDQAEAVLEEALPFLLEFGGDLAELLRAATADQAAGMTRQPACDPLPGIETDFFCTTSTDGVICPVDADTVDWQFDQCMIADGDGMLDGSVMVTESAGSTYELDFNLDIDEGTLDGLVTVVLGDCATLTYSDFDIDFGDMTNTVDGSNEICDATFGANLDVTVSATGVQTFLMDISTTQLVSTVTVIDGGTMAPLYICSYVFNPTTGDVTGSCSPYMES